MTYMGAEKVSLVRVRHCDGCDHVRNTYFVTFNENVSYFVGRRPFEYSGFLCQSCMTRCFMKFETRTMLFTWWGVVGCLVGPAYLFMNCVEYVTASYRLARAT